MKGRLVETRAKVIKISSISNIWFKFRDYVKQSPILNRVFVKSRILKLRVLNSAFPNSSLILKKRFKTTSPKTGGEVGFSR